MDDLLEVLLSGRVHERRKRLALICSNRLRLRRIRDASDPFSVSDNIFKGLYRLYMVRALVEELRPHMPEVRRSTAVVVELQVLCALHFFGQGSYQKSAGSDSNLGLSQPSSSNSIENVVTALNSRQVLTKWIHFPLQQEERMQLIAKNYDSCRIPGVLGFVDGTHVAIRAPGVEEHTFLNRKGYHSLNVMIVCDSEVAILNCLARFGGSSHDSFVWNESCVCNQMRQIWASGEHCWLLGDSGYPHQLWLQTPIANAVDGSPEAHYTSLHIQARNAVERCIGLLKARLRCLIRHRVLEYAPLKAGRIVHSFAMLHNMCVRGGGADEDMLLQEAEDCNVAEEQHPGEMPRMAFLQEARAIQAGIVNRFRQ